MRDSDVSQTQSPATTSGNTSATCLSVTIEQLVEHSNGTTIEQPADEEKSMDTRLTYVGAFVLMFAVGLNTALDGIVYFPIAQHFNDIQRASWIVNSYLITTTALQPIYGKCSDIVGRVPILALSVIFMFIGSLLSGVSSSMDMIIVSRAIQGIGGAGMYTLVNIIIADLFPERKRGELMSYSSASWSFASAAGTIIGGAIVEKSTWRVVFWVNVATSVLSGAVIATIMRLPKPSGTRREKLDRVDFGGSVISLASIVLVLLALSWGGQQYPWSSARVISCIVVGVAIGILFVYYEANHPKEPILPMYLFKTRNVALAVLGHLVFGAVTYAPLIFIPQWALVVKNTTPITSGLYTMPLPIAEGFAVVIAGVLVTRFGRYRECLWFGGTCLLVAATLLITLHRNTHSAEVIGIMVLYGIGFGACIQTLILTAQVGAAGRDSATVTTACLFMRSLGGMIVVAVMSTVSENKRKTEFAKVMALFPNYADSIARISKSQSLIHRIALPDEVFHRIVEVFMKSMRSAFTALVPFSVLFFLAVLFVEHKRLNTVKKITIQ
ncbi:MFS general substrate transporter [Linderina pennispora]|uniref:MFS general substrate transporter n=1 Tax=Linderina pennispora TaxID=61395 RepID=A0A1Y1W9F2_9FUNG|nr:MFS general substrate transporter [Linderina pennispora]ORX69948.1 MFS general substrate transporter [Linderina pennispora]